MDSVLVILNNQSFSWVRFVSLELVLGWHCCSSGLSALVLGLALLLIPLGSLITRSFGFSCGGCVCVCVCGGGGGGGGLVVRCLSAGGGLDFYFAG